MGILRNCGVHLQTRRRHARHRQPVLRVADALPSALGRPAGVDQIFLPKCICDRSLLGRDRELGILNGLDGKQDLAEQPAGRLARAHGDLDGGQGEQRREEPDTHGVPAESIAAKPAALLPAAHEVQRLGGVRPQEVSVDGRLTLPLSLGDSLIGDRDRLLAAAEEIQDGGEVRVHPEQVVEAAQLGGLVAGPAEHLDGGLRSLAPGLGHGKRAGGVQQLRASLVADGGGDFDRFLGIALGFREDALEHPELGKRGEDAGARGGGLARHEAHGALVGGERSLVIARRAPVAAELLHDQAQGEALVRVVQGGRGCLTVGLGAGRVPGGECGLGGPDVQVWEPRHALLETHDLVQGQSLLVVGQGVGAGIEGFGGRGRGQRRLLGLGQLVGRKVVRQRGGRLKRSRDSGRSDARGGE